MPGDPEAFRSYVLATLQELRAGRVVLIHCAAGHGRTGLYATALLLSAGVPLNDAVSTVAKAGSGAETYEQREFLRGFAGGVGGR